MRFVRKISRVAQARLGRSSLTYRLGALAFDQIQKTLGRAGLFPRCLADDAAMLAAVARESIAVPQIGDRKNILFFSPRGWSLHATLETMLASRLQADGHQIRFLSCNDSVALCAYGSVNSPREGRRNCAACMRTKNLSFGPNFDVEFLPVGGDVCDPIVQPLGLLDVAACRGYVHEGAPYGELVKPGLLWYLRRSRLTDDDCQAYREAISTAHVVRRGLERLLDRDRIDTVVLLNGDFLMEKVAAWVLSRRNIRYVAYDYTIENLLAVSENTSVWDALVSQEIDRPSLDALTPKDLSKAEELLESWSRKGGYQGQLFWTGETLRAATDMRRKLGLSGASFAVCYTNLTFESSVIDKNRVFPDQFEWLTMLVKFFGEHPEHQLVIRVHPAEMRTSHWRPNESLFAFLTQELVDIPENVAIVPPSSPVSSYAIGDEASVVLIYSSTIGLEMAAKNHCVITAANSHFCRRGFTVDPETQNEYFASLEKALKGGVELSQSHRADLIAYVAWLFGKRLIPIESHTPSEEGWPQVNVSSISDLLAPNQRGMARLAKYVSSGERWW